jgi:WD40 repeat protein
LRYHSSFSCKNRIGKYSNGRKVTNISFLNRSQVLITTNDSRVRLVNVSDGKLISKYKGGINEEFMIRAYYNETHEMIISASEDGNCILWNKMNKQTISKKNYFYEYFKPFEKDIVSSSFFIGDEITANYMRRMFNITTKIMVGSIIINVSVGGRMQVLLNCIDI